MDGEFGNGIYNVDYVTLLTLLHTEPLIITKECC